jgi:hypothetical protein
MSKHLVMFVCVVFCFVCSVSQAQVLLEPIEWDTSSSENPSGGETGFYKLRFTVTAPDVDICIPATQSLPTFSIVDTNGATATGATAVVLTSLMSPLGGSYQVEEGETEVFFLSVAYTPTTVGLFAVQPHAFPYSLVEGGALNQAPFLPPGDWRSDYLFVRGVPEPGSIGLIVCGALLALRRR